jgi:DNA-directed RNA polymerase specialized sigma24 family protein
VEEAVSDVLKRLMCGALVRFRGETLNELFGFVRTITDRCVWRLAQKKLRERDALEGEGREDAEGWYGTIRHPEALVEVIPEVPLEEPDMTFLQNLLEAESKVEYSRRHGVSRAAVTQRVQRIRRRIAKLEPEQRRTVDAWLHQQARAHLQRSPEG